MGVFKTIFAASIGTLAGMAFCSIAAAQSGGYPNQIVRLVVPTGAGSITDAMGRVIADKLTVMWKQPVVIENRPGLAGTASVAKATPDGYTLLLNSNGHTIATAVNKNVPFDPVKDFSGVMQIATAPQAIIVPPDMPVNSLKEWIALAAAKPGELNFASAGLATATFLAAEIMRTNAKITITHVPSKGATEAMTGVMRNDTQMYFAQVSSASELLAGNKVKVLAVNADKRVPQLPNVPTMVEAGLPDFKYNNWFGLLAPAATPPDILEKLHRDVSTVLAMPDVAEKLMVQGIFPAPLGPKEFNAAIAADTERYTKLLKESGLTAN
jgi:tripartite-type tricarboxylate transporter receptor subunit TctC